MKENVKKLLIVIIIICLVNIVFDAFLYYNLRAQRNEYETILNTYITKEEDMLRLNKLMYEMQSRVFAQVMKKDEASFQANADAIEELHTEIMEVFAHYDALITEPEEYDIYHLVYSGYISYKEQAELIEDFSGDDSVKTAHYYVNTIMFNNLEEMNGNLKSLYEMTEKDILEIHDILEANRRFTGIVTILFGVLSLAVITGLLIAFRRLSGSIFLTFTSEQRAHEETIIHMQSKTIEGMADLVESRDGNTGQHVKNTAYYVELIARKMAQGEKYKDVLHPEYIDLLKRFAPLHDIGKIVISDTILLKPGKLTAEEFDRMKEHTVEGGAIIDNILGNIENPENVKIARDIATYHHEKWDGSGYPSGLSGRDIPLSARIMSIADVFDALISKRCYKDAFSIDSAYEMICGSAGSQFDPDVVSAFLDLRPEIESYLSEK